jgi:DNA repair protein RecO (recombination protein O)
MAKEITDAIVLDTMDFRETSRFLYVYTEQFGRITLIMKGVRKPNSPFTGRYEPFTRGILHFYHQERKTIYMFSDFQPVFYPTGIRSDYRRIVASFFVTEVTQKITMEYQSNLSYYHLVAQTLVLLNREKLKNIQSILRVFELKSIAMHGFQPILEECSVCHRSNDQFRSFSVAKGGVLCGNCVQKIKGKIAVSPGTLQFLKKAFSISLEKMTSLASSGKIERELQTIVQAIFMYYFDREFNSRKLLMRSDFR